MPPAVGKATACSPGEESDVLARDVRAAIVTLVVAESRAMRRASPPSTREMVDIFTACMRVPDELGLVVAECPSTVSDASKSGTAGSCCPQHVRGSGPLELQGRAAHSAWWA